MSYICKRCKNASNLVTDLNNGEIFCSYCGVVIIDKLSETNDYGKTGYTFDSDNTYHEIVGYTNADFGPSSIMDQSGMDAHGNRLSVSSKESFRRLSAWDKKSISRTNKGMHVHLTALQSIASRLGLPHSFEEDAAYQFRKFVFLGMHRKIGRRKLIPVIIYLTCRRLNIPRTLNDIATAANVSNRLLRRYYRRTIMELGENPESIRSANLIPRIATSLNLKEKISRFAIQIASEYENTRYSFGKNPSGIAAASLYLSCMKFGIDISQSHISNVSGISAVTVRNVSKSIRRVLTHLSIDKGVTNKKLKIKFTPQENVS